MRKVKFQPAEFLWGSMLDRSLSWPLYLTQASEAPSLPSDAFDGLQKIADRKEADSRAPKENEGKTQAQEASSFIVVKHVCIYSENVNPVSFHFISTCYFPWTVAQTAGKLKKFLESMIQKSGKLRSLSREIAENYSLSDQMMESNPQKGMPITVYRVDPDRMQYSSQHTFGGPSASLEF